MWRLIALVSLLLTAPCMTAESAAKDSTAQRFDVTIRLLDDGSIQVTETVRMTFEGGPFTVLNREIPLRRTDGIDVLGASMDGHVMGRGTGAGQFEVRVTRSRVAVRWHFPATSDAAHDFRLSYLARGVVRKADSGPRIEWQALPGQHRYRIDAARIVLQGAMVDREPSVRTRRVAQARTARTESGWTIEAGEIGANGWIALAAETTLAAGVVPKWQQRERDQRARAPIMIQMGIVAFVIGASVVLLVWRQYPAAPLVDDRPREESPPANRPPALAAAILAGGHASNGHAPGTIFDLAARNVLTVTDAGRSWQPARRFTIARAAGVPLAPHEEALLQVMFKSEPSVNFARAASRLARGGRPFRHAVNEELHRLGLTDDERRATRRRLFVLGVSLALVGVVGAGLVVVADLAPWGLAIPIGVDLAAALALVLAATRTELSDEGFRERERWRAFRVALKDSIEATGPDMSEPLALRYLPYVAAMGLGAPLARYLKKHGAEGVLPSWFRTLAGSDGSAAFAAFVGATAASTGSSGGASAGTAGGGSSGAA